MHTLFQEMPPKYIQFHHQTNQTNLYSDLSNLYHRISYRRNLKLTQNLPQWRLTRFFHTGITKYTTQMLQDLPQRQQRNTPLRLSRSRHTSITQSYVYTVPSDFLKRCHEVSPTWSYTYLHVVIYQSNLHITEGITMNIFVIYNAMGLSHMVLYTSSCRDLLVQFLSLWRHHYEYTCHQGF